MENGSETVPATNNTCSIKISDDNWNDKRYLSGAIYATSVSVKNTIQSKTGDGFTDYKIPVETRNHRSALFRSTLRGVIRFGNLQIYVSGDLRIWRFTNLQFFFLIRFKKLEKIGGKQNSRFNLKFLRGDFTFFFASFFSSNTLQKTGKNRRKTKLEIQSRVSKGWLHIFFARLNSSFFSRFLFL